MPTSVMPSHPAREVELSESCWLIIGPDRSGNLLGLIVLVTTVGGEVIIHALPLTDQHRRFLP